MPPRAASCILGLVALSLVGCRNGARPAQTVHDPSTWSAAPFPPEVVAVCDTVAGLWRETGRASVRVVDTTVRVLSDSQPQRGCAVVAAAPQGVDSTRWSRQYWTRSDARGWSDLSGPGLHPVGGLPAVTQQELAEAMPGAELILLRRLAR